MHNSSKRWHRVRERTRAAFVSNIRSMGPMLLGVTLTAAAHAQGTIDFSGANNVMGSFKTFAIFAGAIIAFGCLIWAGLKMMGGRFQTPFRSFSKPCSALAFSDGEQAGSGL